MAPNTAAGASVARGYFAIIDKAPRHTLQMVSSSPMSPRILSQLAARWQGSPTYTSPRSGCTNPIHPSAWKGCSRKFAVASLALVQGKGEGVSFWVRAPVLCAGISYVEYRGFEGPAYIRNHKARRRAGPRLRLLGRLDRGREELLGDGVLGSSHLAPVTGFMLTVEGRPANPKRAGSLPYPGGA